MFKQKGKIASVKYLLAQQKKCEKDLAQKRKYPARQDPSTPLLPQSSNAHYTKTDSRSSIGGSFIQSTARTTASRNVFPGAPPILNLPPNNLTTASNNNTSVTSAVTMESVTSLSQKVVSISLDQAGMDIKMYIILVQLANTR